MNKSSLIRLSVIVLLMLMAVLILQKKDQTNNTGNLFLPEVAARIDDIHELYLRNGIDQLHIYRNSASDWVLEQAGNYFVNTGQVAVFLRTLASAKTIEEKTSKPEYYARLGVEDISPAGDTTEVTLDWDTDEVAMLFGNTQGSYHYARQSEQPTAWLVDADVNLSLDATAWMNTELTNIDASDVLEVSIMHSNGESVIINRGADGGYQLTGLPEGRTLKYPSILDSHGSLLSGLNFEQVRAQITGSEQTLKPAGSTTTIALSDGSQIVISRFFDDTADNAGWFRLEITPSDQQSTVLSNAEVQAIRRAVDGWEFQFSQYKAEQFAQTLENLLAPLE